MAAIAELPLETPPGGPWPAVARAARAWLAEQSLALRDSVVLLPFAALLAPAREAFAAGGGWQPRIETPLTLAAALAPPPALEAGLVSGDAVLDRLVAAALLRQQPWGAARERDDRRGFAQLVGALVETAHRWRDAALTHAPAARDAFWAAARERLPAPAGPGALESLLLRVAFEWAAQGGAAATDVLFAQRPAAWVVVRIGGPDALAEALPAATGGPGLVLDLDAAARPRCAPLRWVCGGLEHEAQAAAAEVIGALDAGRVPVALVALDRGLARRVRALLDRRSVPLIDETGWALSTTRSAAQPMSLLRAAVPAASADARLDWLKTWPPALAAPRALDALEAAWRGTRSRDAAAAAAGAALWTDAQATLAPFAARRERPLADWLALLRAALQAGGAWDALRADAAGAPLLQALRLEAPDPAWQRAADAVRLDLAGFTAWVDSVLEGAQFLPPPAPGAEVVITPLARAIGRPFAHIVVPGADHAHLGAIEAVPSLVGESLADALGLDGAARRRRRQRLAFAQLLHAPALTLLRRRRDGDEPLAPSPEVEALALARARAGQPLAPEREWQAARMTVPAAPVPRPAPAAGADLPPVLSASAVEALRACPYRFFARSVLRLAEPEELDAGLAKRDYGNWLHAVLHRFHRERIAGPGADDAAALQRAADAETAAQQIDAAELLPYRASFENFAPAYLAWLAAREADGWRWVDGEAERSAAPDALAPQRLAGRLDRLDRAPDGSLQVIDYKTGSASALRQKADDPLEDTQLAFYAALEPAARSAIYLALDDAKAPLAIEHAGVAATAETLVRALGGELARLRKGAGLAALGEGAVCDTCEARGLCRRDHWSAE